MLTRIYTHVAIRANELRTRAEGASAAEYALLITFIALVVIAGVTLLGVKINQKFTDASTALK